MTTTDVHLAFNLYAIILLGFTGVVWGTGDILNFVIKMGYFGLALMFVISASLGHFSVVQTALAMAGFFMGLVFVNGRDQNFYKLCYFLGIAMAVFTMIRT